MAHVALILLLLISLPARADTAEIANIPAWQVGAAQALFGKGQAGDTVTRTVDGNGNRFLNIKTPINYKSAAGNVYQIVASKTAQIQASSMGKTVMGVVRGAAIGGGIGAVAILGATAVSLLCSETSICQKAGTDDLEFNEPGTFSQQYSSCETAAGWESGTMTQCQTIRDNNQGTTLYWFRSPAPQEVQNQCQSKGSVGWNHVAVAYGNCTNPPAGEKRTPTEQDFTDAEAKIASPNWDQIMIDKGAAIPVQDIPVLEPLVLVLRTQTSTDRDQAGNVTGTTTRNTTLALNDSATSTRPGSVSATETTTITNYNTTNQVTNTTTVNETPPPQEKEPKVTSVSFDTVDDIALPEQEISAPLNTTTWGEGTCPAPIPVNTSFQNFVIPTEQYCEFAVSSRPFVLLIAGISGLMIITGFRKND